MADINNSNKPTDEEKIGSQREDEFRSPSTSSKEDTLNDGSTIPTAIAVKLKNPLAGMTKDELLADVEAFAKEKGLEDVLPLLKRGALVSQAPKDFEKVSELSEDEKQWLRMEQTHRWKQPWMMYFMTSKYEMSCYVPASLALTPANPFSISFVCRVCHCPRHGSNSSQRGTSFLLRGI